MFGQKGLPRSHHHKDTVYNDWSTPPKVYSPDLSRKYSPDLSRKYFPSMDTHSLDSGSLQLKHKKVSGYSSSATLGIGTPPQNKEAKEVSDVFSRFADTTSLHVMPFINRASRWYAKVLWASIFLLATGAWIFHSYTLIKSFISYETTSSVKIVYEPIDFPSITLCNINPARMPDLQNYGTQELRDFVEAIAPTAAYRDDDDDSGEEMAPNNNSTTSGMNGMDTSAPPDASVTTPDRNNDSVSPAAGTPSTPPPASGKRRRKRDSDDELSIEEYEYDDYTDLDDFSIGDSLNWTKYLDVVNDYADIMENPNVKDDTKTVIIFQELLAAVRDKNRTRMGHQLTSMMISCSYDGMECGARNFSRWLDINYGVCWTFNSFALSTGAIRSARSGSSFGLDMVLYIQDRHYIQGLQLGRGIKMDVHPFGTMPFVKENGLSVAPGQQAYLGVRVLNQTRLGGRYGACDDDDGAYVAYYNNTYNYTIEGCINTCLDRTIAEECNCYRRTQRQFYTSEDLKKGYCKTDKETACSREYTDLFSAGELNCACHQACGTVEYETVYSYDTWPEDALWFSMTDAICVRNPGECAFLKDIDGDDRLDFLRQNFIHLKIFYRDLNVQKIEEQPSYGFVQFGSDLGGAIGLWIGASLITLFEILELSCQLCNFCGRRRTYRKRKLLQRQSQNPQGSSLSRHRDYIVHEKRSRPNSDKPVNQSKHDRQGHNSILDIGRLV